MNTKTTGQRKEQTKEVSITVDLGPQIARVAISDEVIARFKDLIARRVFVPGGKLPPERDLAAALAVSRPTLRQALRALQILGVIRSRQGSGSYLAETAADILREPLEFALAMKGVVKTDLFETRCTLEVKLASLAADRRSEEDLAAMREALARMRQSFGNPEKWCEHEIHFHDCIVRAARNAVMSTVMEMLSYMLMESRMETVRLLADYATSYEAHEKVFVQIEKRDARAAARAMTQHFEMMETRAKECQILRPGEDQDQSPKREVNSKR
ncbi:MAG TPA: FadR/GntR family transcriptional regulator [Candidatus Dormibacteraeota bacterium]|nr:FadR/GntR family transcriptional regulator [Candidatus Dormibacteraeota bacterium]